MENNNNNRTEIVGMKRDIEWIKEAIRDIKKFHTNHYPTLSKRVWTNTGILTVVVALLLYLISSQ